MCGRRALISTAIAIAVLGSPFQVVAQTAAGAPGKTAPAGSSSSSASPPSPAAAPSTPAATPASPEADASTDRAREAFVVGASLANQGEWPEALRAFERSSELRAHPVTTYNIAYSERALGHYTRAYKFFRRSLEEHAAATTGTLPDDLLALARAYLTEVEQRLAHVSVRINSPVPRVSIDGRPLEVLSTPDAPRLVLVAGTRDDRGAESPSRASFDLLVDPGRHLILLSRLGAPDELSTETFDAGGSAELVLGPEPVRPPAALQPALPAREQPGATDPKATWMWISYGVGGAGLILGSVFGALAIDKSSYLSGKCVPKDACDARYQGDIDAGLRDATIADVGFAVAGVGAAAGTYFLLTRNHRKPDEKNTTTSVVTPLIGPTMLGARLRF